MGGKMIRNLIIIALLVMIYFGWNWNDVGNYAESSGIIDKIAEIMYNIMRSVKENV